ncbi:TonB-dependent receptor [bacterium]|nr:TonB-dependent receptor [bacterium]
MKKEILFLLLCTASRMAFGQDGASISGKIVEKETVEPMPYVQVMLVGSVNDEIVTGTLTDEGGWFSIAGIGEGSYRVRCSFIGYEMVEIPIFVGRLNTIYDLGTIELEMEVLEGDVVTVEARRTILSEGLDRKSFSIDEFFTQSTGSVLEAMKSLPGVTVDQEGKVMLRGSDKVAILIDGKQSSLTGFGNQKGLDNIPATHIERIEIINNPSARYDASGMAGIINIINKTEERTGFNGEIGFAFAMSDLTTRKEDLPTDLGRYSKNPKYIPSLGLNYRTDHVNLLLQAEVLRQRRLPNNEFTTRTYQNGRRTISQVPENRTQTHYIVNGGLDWFINAQDQISLSSIIDYESHVDTAQVPYINLNTDQRYRYWHWNEEEVTGYLNFRLGYKHLFHQVGHEFNAAVQYTRGWEDESYFLNDSSAVRQSVDNTHIVATEHITQLTVDYIKPLRSGRIEAGGKLQFRTIPVTYTTEQGDQSIIYPGLGEWSDWGENIFAGYVNAIVEKKAFDVEAGFRVEQTNIFYDIAPENIYYSQNDQYDYFEFYPNVRLTFKIDNQNNISAFYNRRVDRPGEPELRIFPKYDDPELLKVGNPYLRPQFTQTLELAYEHSWSSGSVFVSGYYRKIKDPFTRVYSIDDSNNQYDIINKIYHNVGSGSNTGMELLFSQGIARFWKLTGSFNLYQNLIDAYEGTLLFPYSRPFTIQQTKDQTWDLKITHLLTLPTDFQIQLVVIYYAPKNIAQGKQFARSSTDLSIKKGILQNRGEIVFTFNDIFNRNGIKQEYREEDFNALYENYYDTQVVQLGFKYKF